MASGIYSTGTATVVAGGKTVTLIGAIVNGINFSKYDTIVIGNGSATILDVDADGSELTITPWLGSSQTAQEYENHQSGSLRYDDVKIAESLRAQTAALDTRGFYVFVPPGATEPDPSLGDNEQYAFQADTGKLWQKVGGLWVFIGIYKGINPKGVWDSGTAYAVNDVVSRNGSAYMATAANTNSQPPSANWMLLGTGGADATVTVSGTTTGAPGSSASVSSGGTPTNRTLGFTIPRGSVTTVGTTSTGAPGSAAAVTNSGSGGDVTLNFAIPEGKGYRAASTSSVAIGTGYKTYTITGGTAGLAYQVGSFVRVASSASPTNWNAGYISAITSTAITVSVSEKGGSGTFAAWTLNISGPTGPTGSGTGDVLASNNGTDFPDKALFRSNVGAVGGPASSTDWQRAASDGATGKQIKFGGTIDPLDRIDAKPWSILRGADLGLIPNFTRASAKTMLDSAGVLQAFASGVPAITDRGILVEEARTNIAVQCDNFSDASWAKPNVTVATDAVASPNPSYMADTITSGNVTSQGFYQAISGITPNSSYTLSFFAKLGTMAAADFKFAVYDASNGAFIASNISPTVTLTDAGWSRVSYTFTAPAGCTSVRIYPFRANAAVVGTVSIWLVQLEAGSFATSPIYTTSAQATRAADIITRTRTSPTQLSKVIRARTASGIGSTTQYLWQIDDGTGSNRICVYRDTDQSVRLRGFIAGSSVANLSVGTIVDNTDFAIAFRATDNDWAVSLNGGAVVTSTTAAMPTGLVNERWGNPTTISYWNGTISLDAEWSTLLSDAQLQALSA